MCIVGILGGVLCVCWIHMGILIQILWIKYSFEKSKRKLKGRPQCTLGGYGLCRDEKSKSEKRGTPATHSKISSDLQFSFNTLFW